ncbi:MAG: hypothetical protein WDO18_15800 [Acidobacteriota bacterium]
MTNKLVAMTMALGVAIAPAYAGEAQKKAAATAAYKAPRTPDGVPDLQGVYSNSSDVPLERNASLGAKEFYTPEELKKTAEAIANRPKATGPGAIVVGTVADIHYDTSQFGLTKNMTDAMATNRTSILTGETGRVPAMIAAATERQNAQRAITRGHEFDGPENRGIAERCIYWGNEGPPMLPVGYNSTLQIVQGKGYVAIHQEMIHDVRVIPTDGRAHVSENIRQWFGESVGHWEGDTLVVDTTNFNDLPPVGRGASRNLHVIERFTKTGPETVLYQFTVSDPSTWEKSWSGEYPLGKIDAHVYEYACQEGNYGMANILSGARADERKAAAQKK